MIIQDVSAIVSGGVSGLGEATTRRLVAGGARVVMMDLNMTMSVRKGQLQRYLRTLYENRLFYIQEPLLIFSELWRGLRALAVRAKSSFFGTI